MNQDHPPRKGESATFATPLYFEHLDLSRFSTCRFPDLSLVAHCWNFQVIPVVFSLTSVFNNKNPAPDINSWWELPNTSHAKCPNFSSPTGRVFRLCHAMASMASMAFGAHSSVELLAMVEQGKLRDGAFFRFLGVRS